MSVVTVEGLVKNYGDVEAVKGVSFHVEAGEVFSILGPNGAGKSTTVEILEGYRSKTAGSVSVLGYDPTDRSRTYRERIGIVLQETAVEDSLTVSEAISTYGVMYPKRRNTDELIEIVGLEEKRDARVKSLSGGQRRRLELALGIVGDPDLVFMDEPTTGFDPSARRQAWSIIENLTSLGKTILLTTHYMEEAQVLADRVAVMAGGLIVAEGTPESLGGRETAATVISFNLDGQSFEEFPIPDAVVSENGRITVRSSTPTQTVHDITGWAVGRGIELVDLSISRPSLEDVYLELTGGLQDG
jgi:ABC-2 type transport system ATP-binding protein